MNIILGIIIPMIAGIIIYLLPLRFNSTKKVLFLVTVILNFICAILCYGKISIFNETASFIADSFFRNYGLSAFMVMLLAVVTLFSAIYAVAFMKQDKKTHIFYASMLIAVACVKGALFADNFIIFLFFWEALMVPMFLMIVAGENNPVSTAIKAFTISAVADLCLMFGVMLVCVAGDSFSISKGISELKAAVPGEYGISSTIAFVMLFIGAVAKIGAMPFHSWIPEASIKAPLPFMVFMVTAVEKILGVYLLIRITNDFFIIEQGSVISLSAMAFGVISVLVANALAMCQTDFKKMLSYASIGQAGFMIVAISTMSVIGTIAALIHMHAHIIYKSGLFFVAGNIEKTEGTTDINVIKGGLKKRMPYTFVAFLLSGASFAGVPFFYAFYSKEMVYESALTVNWIFYGCLLIGSLMAVITIINWGSKLFFNAEDVKDVEDKEVSTWMFVPTIIFALACALLGLFHKVPLRVISSVLDMQIPESHSVVFTSVLILLSVIVFVLAILNFINAYKKKNSCLGYALPIIKLLKIDKLNSNENLDPYNIFIKFIKKISNFLFVFDKAINYFYDLVIPTSIGAMARSTRKAHNGNMSVYLLWILIGIICIFIIF
ncbi:MAG: proton-conducting transporter membrane subunit [Endomicrobiaceae bacterium]|nr:proton-conducting transporter membrane subunit [Endomicrobiaceae bacterium]